MLVLLFPRSQIYYTVSAIRGQKAETICRIAGKASEFPDDELPPDFEVLTSITGVGPKCANTPEQTLKELEDLVQKKYWIDINRLLMPFGKHICILRLPHCSTCPVPQWCLRIGVTKSQ
jgi:endonuclease-3